MRAENHSNFGKTKVMAYRHFMDCHIRKWVNNFLLLFFCKKMDNGTFHQKRKKRQYKNHQLSKDNISVSNYRSLSRVENTMGYHIACYNFVFQQISTLFHFFNFDSFVRFDFIFLIFFFFFLLSLPTINEYFAECTNLDFTWISNKLVCLHTFFSLFPQPELPLVDTHIPENEEKNSTNSTK